MDDLRARIDALDVKMDALVSRMDAVDKRKNAIVAEKSELVARLCDLNQKKVNSETDSAFRKICTDMYGKLSEDKTQLDIQSNTLSEQWNALSEQWNALSSKWDKLHAEKLRLEEILAKQMVADNTDELWAHVGHWLEKARQEEDCSDDSFITIAFLKRVLNENWKKAFGRKMSCSNKAKGVLKKNTNPETNVFFDFIDLNSNDSNLYKYLFSKVIHDNFSFDTRSEEVCAIRYNNLIFSTLETISCEIAKDNMFKITLNRSSENATEWSDDSIKRRRQDLLDRARKMPNFSMTDRYGRVLFAGEHRGLPNLLSDARSELLKYFANKPNHTGIRFTFGYAASNSDLELLVFDHNCKPLRGYVICKYQLGDLKHRIKLVVNMICLYQICSRISEANQPEEPFFHSIRNGNVPSCVVELQADSKVFKTVDVCDIVASQSENGVQDLLDFYKLIYTPDESPATQSQRLDSCPIKNTVRCIYADACEINDQHTLYVLMTPIGESNVLERVQSDLSQLKLMLRCVLEALRSIHAHGYTHNDIRWPNIVYDRESGRYLLIDFESTLKICGPACDSQVRDHLHGRAADDVEYVGKLLEGLRTSSEEVRVFIKSFSKFFQTSTGRDGHERNAKRLKTANESTTDKIDNMLKFLNH